MSSLLIREVPDWIDKLEPMDLPLLRSLKPECYRPCLEWKTTITKAPRWQRFRHWLVTKIGPEWTGETCDEDDCWDPWVPQTSSTSCVQYDDAWVEPDHCQQRQESVTWGWGTPLDDGTRGD